MSNRKETPDLLGELLGETERPARTREAVAGTSAQSPAQSSSKSAGQRSTRKAASRATQSRATWEYLELIVRDFRGWRVRYLNGDKVRNWKDGPLLSERLADLGADGWEMAGVLDTGRFERAVYFKRMQQTPKESE
ncbi:MAG: hypothetical protein H6642_15040 [Caldilineaceae bacterium]|nr:hypothetical protein [Caldilineaceae bacterium]MCB9139655.1 hypothetical protein [Caldilineaceae bacterium]